MEEFNRVNDIRPEIDGHWSFEARKYEPFDQVRETQGMEVPFLRVKNNTFDVAGKKGGSLRGAFSSSGIAAAAAMAGPGISPESYKKSMYGNQSGRVTWQERVD